MKRMFAAAAVMATLAAAGCGPSPAQDAIASEEAVAGTAAPAAPEASAPAAATLAAMPAAPGAPVFAVVYPGGTVSSPATVAQGPDGPGGILSFTTDAAPETVIAFYRQRAEAAGLASVSAMNQGEARAYGAAAEDGSGKLLRVVATPVENGPTSVQLDWTAGG
jgi:hypothetical protein